MVNFMNSISEVQLELERAFSFFNGELFQSKCGPCMITIQKSAPNGKTLGWTTLNKVWHNGNPEKARFEINVCPHIFHESAKEVLHTLIHKMVHVFLLQNDHKERLRAGGNYHTRKFRDKASAVGLSVFRTSNYGWAHTELPDDGRAINAISGLNPKTDVFSFARGFFQKKQRAVGRRN